MHLHETASLIELASAFNLFCVSLVALVAFRNTKQLMCNARVATPAMTAVAAANGWRHRARRPQCQRQRVAALLLWCCCRSERFSCARPRGPLCTHAAFLHRCTSLFSFCCKTSSHYIRPLIEVDHVVMPATKPTSSQSDSATCVHVKGLESL